MSVSCAKKLSKFTNQEEGLSLIKIYLSEKLKPSIYFTLFPLENTGITTSLFNRPICIYIRDNADLFSNPFRVEIFVIILCFTAGFQELSPSLVEAAVAHCQLIVVSK